MPIGCHCCGGNQTTKIMKINTSKKYDNEEPNSNLHFLTLTFIDFVEKTHPSMIHSSADMSSSSAERSFGLVIILAAYIEIAAAMPLNALLSLEAHDVSSQCHERWFLSNTSPTWHERWNMFPKRSKSRQKIKDIKVSHNCRVEL